MPEEMLKAKFVIGSIHGRTQYTSDERVFHQSDIPEKARQARAQIAQFLHSSDVNRKQKAWDNRVGMPMISRKKVTAWDPVPQQKRIFSEDRHYRLEEAQHTIRKRREDMLERIRNPDGHRVNKDGYAWNQSTSIAPHYIQERSWKHYTLPGKKTVKAGPSTATLISRQTEKMESLRATRRAERAAREEKTMRETIKRQYDETLKFAKYPEESPGMLTANDLRVTRRYLDNAEDVEAALEEKYNMDTLDRYAESEEFQQTMNSIPKPRVKAKSKKKYGNSASSKIVGKRVYAKKEVKMYYEHPGKWEPSRFDEGEENWSCCMSSERDSRGCKATKLYDLNRWNYASPLM